MKSLLAAFVAFGLACEARAADVLAGGPATDFGFFAVSASAPEVVGVTLAGNNLLATTLTVSYPGDDPLRDDLIATEVVIGSNGALHHEQAPNDIPVLSFATPVASLFRLLGVSRSRIDSHFTEYDFHLNGPFSGPAETFSTVPSGVPGEVLSAVGFQTVQTGFGGVLTLDGGIGWRGSEVEFAYLVFEDQGTDTVIDFTLRAFARARLGETLAGFVVIPEPASALLVGVSLVGLGPTFSRSRR